MKRRPLNTAELFVIALLVLAVVFVPSDFKLSNVIDVPFVPSVEPIVRTVEGLQVVIVRESGTWSTKPVEQQAITTSSIVRSFLDAECAKGPDGQPIWRILDPDAEFTTQGAFSRVLERPRDSLPWLVVTNDGRGYEGPLPLDVSAMMEVLKKYAGE